MKETFKKLEKQAQGRFEKNQIHDTKKGKKDSSHVSKLYSHERQTLTKKLMQE